MWGCCRVKHRPNGCILFLHLSRRGRGQKELHRRGCRSDIVRSTIRSAVGSTPSSASSSAACRRREPAGHSRGHPPVVRGAPWLGRPGLAAAGRGRLGHRLPASAIMQRTTASRGVAGRCGLHPGSGEGGQRRSLSSLCRRLRSAPLSHTPMHASPYLKVNVHTALGESVCVLNANGDTPLHFACCRSDCNYFDSHTCKEASTLVWYNPNL